jgi:biopolymer transport protein ExbB
MPPWFHERSDQSRPVTRPVRVLLVRTTLGALTIGGGLLATPAWAQSFVVARNLTVTGMITEADPLVKTVMGILVLASIATWTIFIAKSIELAAARRQLRQDLILLDQSNSLQTATQVRYPTTQAMVDLTRREIQRTGDLRRPGAIEGIKERVAAQLTMIETNSIQSILLGVNVLASIGATSPFIGLAGTVWGIMNSFIGISKSHATNLAIVAPGIAEALLATAMGLIAAIPAVLIYNLLARSIAGYRRLIAAAAVLSACALSRELEGRAQGVGVGVGGDVVVAIKSKV